MASIQVVWLKLMVKRVDFRQQSNVHNNGGRHLPMRNKGSLRMNHVNDGTPGVLDGTHIIIVST